MYYQQQRKNIYLKQQKIRIMKLICIKTVTTKKGFSFVKGQNYNYTINQNSIRVYIDTNNSIVIKNEKTLNKYFK